MHNKVHVKVTDVNIKKSHNLTIVVRQNVSWHICYSAILNNFIINNLN